MNVEDLKIGSPVYRVRLDAIDIARVRLIEAFQDGTHAIELNTSWKPRCVAKTDATEIHETNSSLTVWYVNIEDAELAQLMSRSEFVKEIKNEMEIVQNKFAEAIQKYAFSEPSTPNEL